VTRRGAGPVLLLALVLLTPIAPAAEPCADCVRAGAATVGLALPAGAPLGGYGTWARRALVPDLFGRSPHSFWFRPAEGTLAPLHARALVLDTRHARVAWVALDLIAVDAAFTRAVGERLAGPGRAPTLVLSASHTHSGPGAFADSALMGVLAMDRQDPTVTRALVDATVAAVRRAEADLGEAWLGAATAAAPGLTRGRLGRPPDDEIVVLRVTRPSGAPVAAVWNYAIHGTMLPPRNLRYSGDVMGTASAILEQALGAPALFVNGAVGDVSPAGHGERAAIDAGRRLAVAARDAWSRATPRATTRLATRGRVVGLGRPRLRAGNCTRWAPGFVEIPLDGAFPEAAELTAVAAGSTAWVAVPGELQSALGRAIKDAGRPDFAHVMVAGVTNGYLGYFLTRRDYDRTAYVACASLYGPGAGECLAATAAELLRELKGERPDGRAARACAR
jgi:hypothetical protein